MMDVTPRELIALAVGVLAGVVLQTRPKRKSLDDLALEAELGEPARACFPPIAKPNPAATNIGH